MGLCLLKKEELRELPRESSETVEMDDWHLDTQIASALNVYLL